jgi:DNA helicase-2/ATP-dependent DNA helicase PcrA
MASEGNQDDDQTIFSFCGATPEAFLTPEVPQDHKIILKQSYRVPRAVHSLANSLITQVGRRQVKEYLPRDADGEVERLTFSTWEAPGTGLLDDAMNQVARGKTVMFLAACSYMLKGIIQLLRENGVPFHNPFRKTNGFWNPLKFGTRGSTLNRILALLSAHPEIGSDARPWTNGDLALWAEHLHSQGVLKHGAKKKLQAADMEAAVGYERLDEVFQPVALDELLACFEGSHKDLLAWWKTHLNTDAAKRAEFPASIAIKHGPHALLETPKVVVGTIHSVKGGEADVVYLCPDLSRAGELQYLSVGPPRDSVIRVFYVGATRAREKLVICQRATPQAVAI